MRENDVSRIDSGYSSEHHHGSGEHHHSTSGHHYGSGRHSHNDGEHRHSSSGMNHRRRNHYGGSAIFKILQLIFIMGIVLSAIILLKQYVTRQNAEKIYEDLQMRSTEAVGTETGGNDTSGSVVLASDIMEEDERDMLSELGIEIPEKSLDWDAMREENSDIYAWIYVPGTSVDYPVLQSAEDDDYYLKHNLDGSSGYPGCIYTQSVNRKDFTDFTTVLYGHNMKNGTMFKTLVNYSDAAFFGNNRYIYVYTPEKVLVYRIFAAVSFGNGNVLHDYDMGSVEDRQRYINDLMTGTGNTDATAAVTAESHIITLSTCLDNSSKNRWLVNGVLLNP